MEGRSLNQYQIESELGHGGMGIVYRARDTKLDRTVAIKFLASDLTSDDVARQRFIREAKAAAAVEHDSICAIFEIGESDDGQTFIVMPYYEGKTVKDLIAEGPIDAFKAMDLCIQIGSGLAAAHAKGIVHRDIKPGNVIVTKRGKAKILDFGLAKLGGQLDLTKTKSSVGTVPYMSPEQIRGDVIDERTDIWALGAVMYEMLAGRRPFTGEYEQAVTYSILNVDPLPLGAIRDDLPEGLADVVARCMAKKADERYQTVSDLLKDIEVPSGVRPFTGSYTRELAPERGKKWAVRVVAGVILALAVWAAFVYFGRSTDGGLRTDRNLAVLPFDVSSESSIEESAAYSAGLHEAITGSLTRLEQLDPTLWVIPASEVSDGMSVSDARETLGANLVVTGSVQFAGARARVNLTLYNAETGRSINSAQYEDSGTSAFAIQDEAVRQLFSMLEIVQSPEGNSVFVPASTNRLANESYLKAIGYQRNQQTVDDLNVVIGLLTSAIDEDPNFALAYAAMGSALWSKYGRTREIRWANEADEYSRRALELNNRLPEVHITLGTIRHGLRDYEAAYEEFQEALQIDSLNSEAYRLQASSLRGLGRNEEALESIRRTIELAPDYWRSYYARALHEFNLGSYEEAIRYAEQGLQRKPDVISVLNLQAVALWRLGRVAEAMARFERMLTIDPSYETVWQNMATGFFYLHRYDESVEYYEKVVRQLTPSDYEPRGYLADAYYWAGRRDDAARTYQEALQLAREQLAVNDSDPELLASMAGYFAHLGQPDSARIYVEEAIGTYATGAVPAGNAIGLGEVYALLDEPETAKQWIEQALAENAGWMRLQFSPWLEEIREDVDFMNRIAVYRR